VNLFRGQKVKVTTPTNAHTVNAQYLRNGKAYEHQTWYTEHLKNIATSLLVLLNCPLKLKWQADKIKQAMLSFYDMQNLMESLYTHGINVGLQISTNYS